MSSNRNVVNREANAYPLLRLLFKNVAAIVKKGECAKLLSCTESFRTLTPPNLMWKFVFLSVFLVCLLLLSFSFGQTPPSPQAAAAMNAGLQHLKDSKWLKATESFALAVNLAPTYAPAHIGLLCASLQVTEEKLLEQSIIRIDNSSSFKSALEHADPAYKRQIQGYADSINARVKAINDKTADRKAGERMVLTINGVEYAFRWCPAGMFMYGSPEDEAGRIKTDIARQQGTVSLGFWMLETEVTQMMWASVMGNNPSKFRGDETSSGAGLLG